MLKVPVALCFHPSLKERSLLGRDSDHLSSSSLGSASRRVLVYIHHLPVEIGLESFASLKLLASGCLLTVAQMILKASVPWTPHPGRICPPHRGVRCLLLCSFSRGRHIVLSGKGPRSCARGDLTEYIDMLFFPSL